MKRLIFCLLFFLPGSAIHAQDYYADLEKQMLLLTEQKRFSESIRLSEKILSVFPDNITANICQAAALIFLNRPAEAELVVNAALLMDPTSSPLCYSKGYLLAAKGDQVGARKALLDGIRYGADDPGTQEVLEEMKSVGSIVSKQEAFASLASWFQQQAPKTPERSMTLSKLTALYNKYPDYPDSLKWEAKRQASAFNKLGMPDLSVYAYAYAARWLDGWGYPSEALEIATEGYLNMKANGDGSNPFAASQLLTQLITYQSGRGDQQKALQFIDEFLPYVGKCAIPSNDVAGLSEISAAYSTMRKQDAAGQEQARKYAIQAFDLATSKKYLFGIAKSANAVVMAHLDANSPEATTKGIAYGEQGFKVANENKLAIKTSLISNLALLYWNTGREGRQKCLTLYRYQIETAKKEGRLTDASLYLNNLGSMYYSQNELEHATSLFEESAALAGYGPQYKNPADRLSHYQNQMSAYQWLVACYAKAGDAALTFGVMERSRARVLNERLSKTTATETPVLYDLQNLLKPDEACIMYDVFSGHELTILVVTKKYAHVLFHDDARFVGDIMDKYSSGSEGDNSKNNLRTETSKGFEWITQKQQRTQVVRGFDKESVAPKVEFDRIAKVTRRVAEDAGSGDEMLMDMLTRYTRFLLLPVNNRLGGIKTLIISPNDILSFLPFEALRLFDGKYLVEKYNIRYLHSTSVLMQLEARKYEGSRRPLLAMGGAIYEDMDEEPLPLSSVENLNVLQASVAEGVAKGTSMRKAYAGLLGTKAMNPLPGTLEEVKAIGKVVPGADIFTGKDMTENRLKALSKSGDLQKYKILHLATHGFVIAQAPELSGVAMCIPPKPADGEDGFLNTAEISNLQLRTDLTVLSACQTALGQLFVGEGVSGLTQSLLLAGSNAALVSLWPVSDQSTMLFMSDFYKEAMKGKPHWQIVNDLKRKFIKGDYGKEFQHPSYWAPFIYYGK